MYEILQFLKNNELRQKLFEKIIEKYIQYVYNRDTDNTNTEMYT